MNILPFSRERRSKFYYSNYLHLPDVQEELVDNVNLHLQFEELNHLSEDQIRRYITNRNYSKEDIINRYGRNPVFRSVRSNSVYLVKHIIDLGFSADSYCALDEAIEINNVDIMNLLFDRGCRIYIRSFATMAEFNRMFMVKCYLSRGARFPSSAISKAAKNGHLEMVKLLVNSGAQIDENALQSAANNGHLEIVKFLFEKGAPVDDWTMHNAADNGNYDIVKYLFDNGVNIDMMSMNNISNLETFKYLFERGAPVGESTVEELAYKNTEIVKYLAEAKQPISESVIAVYAEEGNFEMVKFLMEKSKEMNSSVRVDSTALVGAINSRNNDIIKYLIDSGVPIDWRAVVEAALIQDRETLSYLLQFKNIENKIEYRTDVDSLHCINCGF